MTIAASGTGFFFSSLLPIIIAIVSIAGAAVGIYILILVIRVLHLSIRALQKYLQ